MNWNKVLPCLGRLEIYLEQSKKQEVAEDCWSLVCIKSSFRAKSCHGQLRVLIPLVWCINFHQNFG